MENAKHTPGPWMASSGNMPFNRIIKSIDGDLIAKVADVCVGDVSSNSRLIAAAPELLDVAQSILADDMLQYLPAEYVAKVRAAIAKATGDGI